MSIRLVFCLWLLLIGSLPALSQESTKRCRWMAVTTDPFSLDSLTVVPGTITFSGARAAAMKYQYDPATNQFRFLLPADSLQGIAGHPSIPAEVSPATGAQPADSVMVCYRVLPFNLAMARFKRQPAAADSLSWPGAASRPGPTAREELFRTPGLSKTGTLTRGISVGNRQNVFVNSALNLQLNGKLSEEISITAAVTDQNIPYQVEGNTSQLQEFDKVFIALQHRSWNLAGGDVVLQQKPGYFLQFYKNVQGGSLEVRQKANTNKQATTSLAASVAKGKFASRVLPPQDGVQGPYRLTGPNNEKFIVVLANSEKVYLDGQLLSRGYDFDYVIDYNLAEITFTARRLITRYSRIRVDFEYSDRNYNRSVYHASHYQQLNKLQLNFNIYNESDNPHNLLALDLSQADKELLQAIGDSLGQAFTSGAEPARYDRELILYRDSTLLVDNQPVTMYVYTQDSTLSRYFTLRFTDLGPGQGDYIAESSTINGRVYRYVPPRDGRRQGRFAPVRILPTPRRKQMATLGGAYAVDKETKVFFESALSENDINRYSARHGHDDTGRALRLGYAIEDKALDFLKAYKLRSSLSYEYTHAHFEAIDRFRDIDFNRDWSLPLTGGARAHDNILDFGLGLHKNPENQVSYRLSRRYRQNQVAGVQHYLDLAQQLRSFQLKGSFFLLDAAGRHSLSAWSRGLVDLSYPVRKLVPGYTYRFDKNLVNSRQRLDSLIASAMYFEEHTWYIRSQDTATTRYRLAYAFRQDRPPGAGELGSRQASHTYSAALQTSIGEHHDLDFIGTFRQGHHADSLAEASVLSTARWLGSFLDRHLRSEMDYSLGTGREPRRVYEFVEVAPGQGTHYLLDKGNPQNLNDYFEAQVPDARYRTHIKVFLPTDQYVTAYMNQFSYRLNSSMPRHWQQKGRLLRVAARLSALTALSINKKSSDTDVWRRFNPFGHSIADDRLLSLASTLRHTFFYNRSDPTFGLEWTWQENTQKLLLANGTDLRQVGSATLTGRYNLNQFLSTQFTIEHFTRASRSSYLETKNFRILGHELAPELSFQPRNSFRLTGAYRYTQKENAANSDKLELAAFHELGLETRWSQVSKRTLSANLRFIRVAYSGNAHAATAYEMLNALRPGNNLTWNVIVQQKLSNGLNASFNYDGRKPQGLSPIHGGRMQVTVLF